MTVSARTDVRVSPAAFDQAADACGVPRDVQQVMWDRLTASAAPERLGVRNVAWYGGACVSLVAMGLFLGTSWASIGSAAGLALTLAYLLAFVIGCEALRVRGHAIPAGLLAATAVALVPLAVFAAQKTFGLWTESSYGDSDGFIEAISGQWVVTEVLTVAAAVAAWVRYRTPSCCCRPRLPRGFSR